MTGYLLEAFQCVLTIAAAPGLIGLVRWLKARLQGRMGSSPVQPYRDLRKLLKKEVIVSTTASWIFRVTPYLLFSSMVVISLLVPLIAAPLPFDAVGDLVVVVYLLLLGTFFLSLAGLDPGTAFGGMGASREMTIAALAEPALALAIFGLGVGAGSTNLGQIVVRTLADPASTLSPGHLFAFASLFIVMLAETGRLPVDNPATHLELTMIHEAMILEYSGRYLALVEWAAAMKLFIFFSLLANLFVPWGVATTIAPGAIMLAIVFLLLKVGVLAVALALLETTLPKLRLFRVPELLSVAFLFAFLAVTSSFLVR
jgi:formate hydrogenlyase subunit 4